MIRAGAPSRDDSTSDPLDDEQFTETIATRITKEMHGQILHLVNSENTSYQGSASKFMRQAVVELLHAWGMKLPSSNPVSNWARWDLPRRERAMELRRLLKFREWLGPFELALRHYMADDDPEAVLKELNEIRDFITSIKGTNAKYWRRKCATVASSIPAIKDAMLYISEFPQYHEETLHFADWGA